MNQWRFKTIRISLALIQLLEPETLIKEKLDDKRETIMMELNGRAFPVTTGQSINYKFVPIEDPIKILNQF